MKQEEFDQLKSDVEEIKDYLHDKAYYDFMKNKVEFKYGDLVEQKFFYLTGQSLSRFIKGRVVSVRSEIICSNENGIPIWDDLILIDTGNELEEMRAINLQYQPKRKPWWRLI